MSELSFTTLRAVNVARRVEGWSHPLDGWSLDDWIIAVAGEIGEACNIVKKMNRFRDRLIGNDKPIETLLADLADELADAVIYLDLLHAVSIKDEGIDAALCVRWGPQHFGHLREVTMVEWNDRLTASSIGAQLLVSVGQLVNARRPDVPIEACMEFIDRLAYRHGIDLGAAVVSKFNRTSEKHGMPHRLEVSA